MYRMIAFDMDGTLLNSHHEILPSSLEAIAKASEMGKEVVLSTGRPLSELKSYLPDLKIVRYGVLTSGALIYDFEHQTVLAKKAIPSVAIDQLVEMVADRDILLIVMLDGQGYVAKTDFERLSDFYLGKYEELYQETAVFVDDMPAFLSQHREDFEKINLYHLTAEEREKSFASLQDYHLALACTDEAGLEVTALGADKGEGLAFLCDYLSLALSDVIAVGDADNDKAMLTRAGLGLAMGNAKQSIKDLAVAVLSDHDNGGCAQAIEHYLLS